METKQISIAKALKLKNRLAGQLAKAQQEVQSFNSTLTEQTGIVDVKAVLKQCDVIQEALVLVKTRIMKANLPIQEQIILKGELKSRISFLDCIPTTDGIQRHGYQNTDVSYTAILKKPEIDKNIKALEKQINDIQDRLDDFNAITKIEVPDEVLNLV